MSDKFDANRWLNGPPDDPEDVSRRVHLDRMITTKKRFSWLFTSLPRNLGIGAGFAVVIWQAAIQIAERFPAP
jgi:hypothetical protein